MMNNKIIVLETGFTPVSIGPGWISGTPANLAPSATVACLFDLGPGWMDYISLQVAVRSQGPSTGLINITASSRDNAVAAANANRYLKDQYNTSTVMLYTSVTTANGLGCFNIRHMGRYLVIVLTNGDATNAQGPLACVTVAAYTS